MKKVILDVDPGIDDSLAIILALKSKKLDVRGITAVSGNVTAPEGAKNAKKILEFIGFDEIPVYTGEYYPWARELQTAQDTHGDDGLGNTNLPDPKILPEDGAVDFILKTIEENPDEITVIAVGPLTNIASCLKKAPETFNKVKDLIVMGGTAKSHGNCSPVAEFNFWADPHAANYVFQNINKPLTMVGLDVTREIVLTPNFRELLYQFNTPVARLVNDITRFYVDFHWKQEKTLGCVINDPLAVAVAYWDDLVKTQPFFVEVIEEGKSMGQSMVDFASFHGKEPNAKICYQVNSHDFMQHFLRTICPEFREDIDRYFQTTNCWEVKV